MHGRDCGDWNQQIQGQRLRSRAEAEWRPRMEHGRGQRLMEGSSDSLEDLTRTNELDEVILLKYPFLKGVTLRASLGSNKDSGKN